MSIECFAYTLIIGHIHVPRRVHVVRCQQITVGPKLAVDRYS